MADIELRFHKDMLVLSAPINYALARQGVNVETDAEYMGLLEPETMRDALRMEVTAGAQCLVATTEGITEARLAHKRFEDRAADIAEAALASAAECKPQHIVCEIGPCGLPLDPSSDASLEQSRAQYEQAVRTLLAASEAGGAFDAILLNGMRSACDMRCAIEGVRRAWEGPLMASLDCAEDGALAGVSVEEAVAAMEGADVVGFCGSEGPEALSATARRMAELTDAPLLVQVRVRAATPAEKKRASLGAPVPENPYALPDALADAALALRAAGVQFLRATGQATPACTGALAVAALGTDCLR